MLRQGRFSRASDAYSFGVTMRELVDRDIPMKELSAVEVIARIIGDGYQGTRIARRLVFSPHFCLHHVALPFCVP